MGPAKSDVCESLVLEYEEDELSPAQLEHKAKIEQKIDILNKHIQGLHQEIETNRAKEAAVESLSQQSHIPSQTQGATSVQATQNSSQSSNYVVVDSNVGFVALPSSQVRRPVVTPVRFPTPSSSSVLRGAAPQPLLPRTGRGGGTAIRQRRPNMVRGSNVAIRMPLKPDGILKRQLTASEKKGEKKNDVVDLTDEDFGPEAEVVSKADTKEVTISPLSEKTFPSLVVLARPNMSPKQFTNQQVQTERANLDEKVKQVLTLNTPKYIEWLLQHGLLRSEQECNSNIKGKSHLPLKLGMYSDTSKFPYSGGYVWISECCPSHFLSVFSGSLFEATPHSPTVVLKLIYHWACQTAVQNVIQWVKVDNLFIKTLYTNLRAICTAAIHQRFPVFGGPNKKVQIGVISLGTTAQDGTSRQVKVEILGIFDESTNMLRIRAIEPVTNDKNEDQVTIMKRRFQKALEPLLRWVHKSSEVVIDCTVDKGTLISYGYSRVIQVAGDQNASGYKIMDYLKVVIPRMFQNTLSLLSRQIIQQFLDELVWREAYGPIPSRAFESIIEHISEQTRLNSGGTLVNRLSRISLNPFRNWEYERWVHNCRPTVVQSSKNEKTAVPVSVSPYQSKKFSLHSSGPEASGSAVKIEENLTTPPPLVNIQSSKRSSSNVPHEPAMIALEPYYYGILEGDSSKHRYVPFFTQCYLCRSDFKSVLKLTDHLILHALNKELESVSDPKDICKICLKIRLPGSKQHHIQMCQPTTIGLSCRICAMKMKDNGSLIYHMTKTHHQLDMPYICSKCNYRVSELHMLNAHFAKAHFNGTSGMCPFCLKIVDFATPSGDDLEHNQLFFIKHIQRHVLPSSKKCSRCLLNFINKSLLAEHETVMHASCVDNDDVMRYLVDNPILMPAPIAEPPLVHRLQPMDMKPASQLKGISTVSLRVTAYIPSPDICCHECESPVTPDHFSNFLMCNKCSYRTCCPHAIAEHVSQMHPPYPLSSPVYIGMKVTVNTKMFCTSCLFSCRDGNVMGTHLVTCGEGVCILGRRRSIIKSEEIETLPIITPARKRGRKTLKAAKDEKPKTILNLLGLVRKEEDGSGAVVESGESSTNDAPQASTAAEENVPVTTTLQDDDCMEID